jgi:hypothetical protein
MGRPDSAAGGAGGLVNVPVISGGGTPDSDGGATGPGTPSAVIPGAVISARPGDGCNTEGIGSTRTTPGLAPICPGVVRADSPAFHQSNGGLATRRSAGQVWYLEDWCRQLEIHGDEPPVRGINRLQESRC